MARPTNDEYFMSMAKLVASRSTCIRRQVGAVIVKDKRVLSTGYNGSPKGTRHCEELGCIREQLHVPSGMLPAGLNRSIPFSDPVFNPLSIAEALFSEIYNPQTDTGSSLAIR